MAVQLTVRHHFSAGHRIPGLAGPGSKCSNLHGHTFGVSWTFEVPGLDAVDFEFTAAKAALRGWVDRNLDHGYLVAPGDDPLIEFLAVHAHKFYVVGPVPTTEAIANLLMDEAAALVDALCVRVEVTEGPHNAAVVTL